MTLKNVMRSQTQIVERRLLGRPAQELEADLPPAVESVILEHLTWPETGAWTLAARVFLLDR